MPHKLPTSTSRLIGMAVTLVGEAQSVMLQMRCSHVDFREYCFGLKEPSAEEFDRLIELIVLEQRRMIDQNRELLAQVREGEKPQT
ncbi:MAG TPA: hypothetical protein VGX52_01380 [Burkholderiales bacterium]|nr:hypothetical protein [Burkholderiales bacterium]